MCCRSYSARWQTGIAIGKADTPASCEHGNGTMMLRKWPTLSELLCAHLLTAVVYLEAVASAYFSTLLYEMISAQCTADVYDMVTTL